MKFFLEYYKDMKILDVGGSEYMWSFCTRELDITILNLNKPEEPTWSVKSVTSALSALMNKKID